MPFSSWRKIAEQRIQEASERGELNDLPGQGEPLKLEDDSRVPEELRLAYKMLKTAGFTPPELDARKELMQVEDMLANAPDEKTRYQAIKRLNYLTMKMGVLKPQSAALDDHQYASRIIDRLSKPAKDQD
ncbi:MAG: DUF1992 domain-containing protein [Desulfarculaceae bacterium]